MSIMYSHNAVQYILVDPVGTLEMYNSDNSD
jgi:hypothetical protein